MIHFVASLSDYLFARLLFSPWLASSPRASAAEKGWLHQICKSSDGSRRLHSALLPAGPSDLSVCSWVAPPPSPLSYFGDGYRRVLLAFSYQNTKEMLSN